MKPARVAPTLITPTLITFDVFGTLVDWRAGLAGDCAAAGHPIAPADFDRIIDAQASLEAGPFQDYAAITAESLTTTLGMDAQAAAAIGANCGAWPFFDDAPILATLMAHTPCAAMTNSDRTHGAQLQTRLGFQLTAWLTAQDVGAYKPSPEFWQAMAAQQGITPGPHWWHASAYADYDLEPATKLGLTTILIPRPHHRPGPATHTIPNLTALEALVRAHK
jgi:2-haloalkanoic acid dehalogenase type II